MRKRSFLRTGDRRHGECSDFVELARRMNIPADVAIHEYMGYGTRSRSAHGTTRPAADAAERLVLASPL